MTPDWIEVDMSWIRELGDPERAQFYKQAMELGAHFEHRDRHNVTGACLNLATVAMVIGPQSQGTGPVTSSIPTEWTTPAIWGVSAGRVDAEGCRVVGRRGVLHGAASSLPTGVGRPSRRFGHFRVWDRALCSLRARQNYTTFTTLASEVPG